MVLPLLRKASAAFVRAGCDFRECISSTGAPIAAKSSAYSCVSLAVTKKAMTLKSGSSAACSLHASQRAGARSAYVGTTAKRWSTAAAVWTSSSPTVSTNSVAPCGP